MMHREPADVGKEAKTIRVILADDEVVIREALQDLLADEPRLEVIGTAEDAAGVIKLAHDLQPDVALVDIKMPGGGVAAAAGIHKVCPSARILALTAYFDRHSVLGVLRAGACGYLIKGQAPDRIAQNILWAVDGQAIIPRTVMRELITELSSQLELAEGLLDQVKDLDRKKGELVQVLAHELRTPVTVLQGTAITLANRAEALSKEQREQMVSSIRSSARRIDRIANHVSESAFLTDENVQIATGPLTVKEIISSALSEFSPAQASLILWDKGIEHSDDSVWAHPRAAARCLVQLLDNALDFSPPGQSVDIEVSVLPEDVEIKVSDRGPGVPDEMKESVFDLFTQGDSSTVRTHEGAGMGLYLARRLMKAQDGSVRVVGRQDAGSTFILSFARFHVDH